MRVPSKLNKDEAFSHLMDSVCNTVSVGLQQTTEIACHTWAIVGEEITDYLALYPDETLNKIVSTGRNLIKQQLGWAPSKATLYQAVKFHELRMIRGDSVEDVLKKHGSWRQIRTKYLKEGGGCNNNEAASGDAADSLTPPSPPSSYEEYALSLPCPICRNKPVEKAHYPTTVKAGAKDDEWMPLCHECHMTQHEAGFISWFDMYGRKLFKEFVYPTFRKIHEDRQK